MCLITIAYNVVEDRKLIIAANRDEYFQRPSKSAHFWEEYPDVYGGLDLEANGTWMAVDRKGRFGVVANWTETETRPEQTKSRGELVKNFLIQEVAASTYLEGIDWDRYRGVNVLLFDGDQLHYANNRRGDRFELDPGFYGMTNTHLFDDWQRAEDGVALLKDAVSAKDIDMLVDMLFVNEISDSSEVLGYNFSPCFIVGTTYGTRSSAAIVFNKGHIDYCEQIYGPMGRVEGRFDQRIELK